MKYLSFFEKNRPTSSEVVVFNEPKPDQIEFANTVLEVFSPVLESHGFIRTNIELIKYSTTIIFRKEKQYIKIYGSSYPTDYPNVWNIMLGEDMTNKELNKWDWIPLYQLKNKIESTDQFSEYNFPYALNVESNIIEAKNDLTTYASSFLNGDLDLFHGIRSKLNTERGPFKITIIRDSTEE